VTRCTASAAAIALSMITSLPSLAVTQAKSKVPHVAGVRFDSLAFRGSAIDNPLFPLAPGTVFVFEVKDGDEISVDSITVTRDTKRIAGVTAVVVHDRLTRGGATVEDTFDWYAQDTAGTVWYLGEDTKEFRAGKVISTAGSWQAGIAGAVAGIIMKAHPRVGETYRQEYRRGVAEDMGRVVSVSDSVSVRAGRFARCITTEDWTPLEPKIRERKTYCPNVGLVRERIVSGGSERSELIAVARR
jgi:hypothetical protein